jgi:hypothetical protein
MGQLNNSFLQTASVIHFKCDSGECLCMSLPIFSVLSMWPVLIIQADQYVVKKCVELNERIASLIIELLGATRLVPYICRRCKDIYVTLFVRNRYDSCFCRILVDKTLVSNLENSTAVCL